MAFSLFIKKKAPVWKHRDFLVKALISSYFRDALCRYIVVFRNQKYTLGLNFPNFRHTILVVLQIFYQFIFNKIH